MNKKKEKSSLDLYCATMLRNPIMSDSEIKKNLQICRNGNKNKAEVAKTNIIYGTEKLVFSIARKHTKWNDLMDLISEGNIGLLYAIDNFDLEKDYKFITYATYWIRKYILGYKVEKERTVRQKNIQKVSTYLKKSKEEFVLKNQREPKSDELGDFLMDEYNLKVNDVNNFIMTKTIHINKICENKDKNIDAFERGEFSMKTSSCNIYNEVDDEYNKIVLSEALNCLDNDEKYVVERTYGVNLTPSTKDNIAKELSIRKVDVDNIMKRAMKKMKHKVNNSRI